MTATLLPFAATLLLPARLLIGLWVLLSAAQWLAAQRSPAPWGPGSDWSPRGLRVLYLAHVALALWMMTSASVWVLILCLVLLLASNAMLLWITGMFWADGSEKIGMIAMAGTLGIALGVALRDPALALAGASLAGGQTTLCYAIAGWSKIPVAAWRDGRELTGVMASRSFGHPGLARLLARHRGFAMLGSWTVIVAEAAFPLALLAPQPVLIAALATLFAFHLGTAIFMGLNKFPWAFAATYPAVLLLGQAVRSLL